jgi:hypothetical protein
LELAQTALEHLRFEELTGSVIVVTRRGIRIRKPSGCTMLTALRFGNFNPFAETQWLPICPVDAGLRGE